jgi:hypothetical protein
MLSQIHNILYSKVHNAHYLNRYYKFIVSLIGQKHNGQYTEKHHICPKSRDLFPEYANLKLNPWNQINLTSRQHFIAHWLLWKAYGGSQRYAFLCMTRGVKNKYQQERVTRLNSKTHDILKRKQYNATCGKNNIMHVYNIDFKGESNPFYGKKHTLEVKKYIGSIHKNKIESDDTRKKKSKSHLGKKHDETTIAKMKSLKWFYDPTNNKQHKCYECPPGCLPGRGSKS